MALTWFWNTSSTTAQHSPYPYIPPKYGAKVKYARHPEDSWWLWMVIPKRNSFSRSREPFSTIVGQWTWPCYWCYMYWWCNKQNQQQQPWKNDKIPQLWINPARYIYHIQEEWHAVSGTQWWKLLEWKRYTKQSWWTPFSYQSGTQTTTY